MSLPTLEEVIADVKGGRLKKGDAVEFQFGTAKYRYVVGAYDKMLTKRNIQARIAEHMAPVDGVLSHQLGAVTAHCGATEEEVKQVKEYTGGSVSYYSVAVPNPTTGSNPYTAECNDIIEALGMNYAEGNAFKAIWRMCAARQGRSKQGYKDALYDAEKVVFFGARMVEMAKASKEKAC